MVLPTQSGAMVGMARKDRPRAVQLFDQDHTGQRVRQRHAREPQLQSRIALDGVIEAVGTADDERDGLGRVAPA